MYFFFQMITKNIQAGHIANTQFLKRKFSNNLFKLPTLSISVTSRWKKITQPISPKQLILVLVFYTFLFNSLY